jgi:tetratricopeptide (TPR) repeat protein
MKPMRRIFIAATLALVGAISVLAGDAGRQSPLSIGAGARGIGMGGGLSPLANDASAVYDNPAGLSMLNYQEFAVGHTLLMENSLYDFGAWAYPISERSGVGVGYLRLGTGGIMRRADYQDLGEFDYTESELLFSYGQRFDWFATGVTLKVLNQAIDNLSDYGFGMDAGLLFRVGSRVQASAVVRDAVAAQVKLNSVSQRVPQTYVGGLGLQRLKITDQTSVSASVTAEGSSGRAALFHAGGELLFYDAYALRGGFDRNNLTVGAGLRTRRIAIDYAFKLQTDLDAQHTFSLSFLIGPSVADQLKQREALRNAATRVDPRELYLNALKDTANSYMHQFRLDSALAYFRKLYDMEPENQEYIGTIAAIENAQRVQKEQEEKLRLAQIELDQFLQSYYDQARTFYDKKYYVASGDLLKLIFDIQPENEPALALLAEIHTAIERDIASYTELAKQAEQQVNRIETIEACNRILSLDSTNVWAKQSREQALAGMDIAKHLNIGIDLFNKGQTAEAAKRFRSVLEARPKDVVALEYLHKIDSTVSKVATLEDLQQDRAVWPQYLEGLRHMRDKKYDEAIEVWQKVLKAYPNQPNTLNNIEQARLRLKTEQSGQ